MIKYALKAIILLSSFVTYMVFAAPASENDPASFNHHDISAFEKYRQEAPYLSLNDHKPLNLGLKLEYFEDKKGHLPFNEIRNLGGRAWSKSTQKIPNFGYTDSSYWFRVRLINDTPHVMNKIIAIQYALLDHIEFYHIERGKLLSHDITGDIYPFSQRPIRHRDFLFPIALKPSEVTDIYFKVQTQGSTQLPISLWDAQQFIWADKDEQFIKALYYGMMLVLIFYNFFLFISIRERPYLYYVGFAASVLILMSGAHGFLYQYAYPESPHIHKMSMLIAVPSLMLFAGIFSSYFLKLNQVAPRLNTVLNALVVLFLLCIAGAFFLPYDVSTRISVFMSMPASIIIMFAGPYAWYKGQTSARYFTFAWAFLITGMIVSAASKFGVLPRNGFTEHAISWGSAIEALLLSFALADRFNKERIAKFKAQKSQLIESEQRKNAETKLYYQATHQPINGFPNIVLLQQVMHKLSNSESESLNHFSLVFLHLSRVQEVNKTLGHANADVVLGLFSKRLSQLKTDSDASIVIEKTEQGVHHFAHIEGMIFAQLLKTGGSHDAVLLVQTMMKELAEPIEYNGMKLDLGLSIGIASFPTHGSDIETLIRHAHVAVDYSNNENERIAVYSQEINPYSARRLVLMGELKKAIDNNTLALHYQPIICCQSGKIIGAEALLRWNHEELGFIPPDEFVLLAEQTGMMRPLTYWVLDNALAANVALSKNTDQAMISVNISAINLHEKDFEANVIRLLEKHQVAPENLVLEITETSVMKDPENASLVLNNLAERGIKLAIDDFGTGHSSLSYIRQLPVYEIKIDRSFVMEMDKVEGDEVIVKTTLNMCRDLGYKVVAEGIESQKVLSTLKTMGCDFAQGYHIAKPMPLESLLTWKAPEA